MPTDDRPWSDADQEAVAAVVRPVFEGECWCQGEPCSGCDPQSRELAAAVLDALTAAGWRPPPPEPDGIHWRVGGSVGCTIYNPYGDLGGMLLTPEAAAAVVATLNAHADEGDADAR